MYTNQSSLSWLTLIRTDMHYLLQPFTSRHLMTKT